MTCYGMIMAFLLMPVGRYFSRLSLPITPYILIYRLHPLVESL